MSKATETDTAAKGGEKAAADAGADAKVAEPKAALKDEKEAEKKTDAAKK